jgi:hypothetical protein
VKNGHGDDLPVTEMRDQLQKGYQNKRWEGDAIESAQHAQEGKKSRRQDTGM